MMIVEHIDLFDFGLPIGATASFASIGVTRDFAFEPTPSEVSAIPAGRGGPIVTTFCKPEAPGSGPISQRSQNSYTTGKGRDSDTPLGLQARRI